MAGEQDSLEDTPKARLSFIPRIDQTCYCPFIPLISAWWRGAHTRWRWTQMTFTSRNVLYRKRLQLSKLFSSPFTTRRGSLTANHWTWSSCVTGETLPHVSKLRLSLLWAGSSATLWRRCQGSRCRVGIWTSQADFSASLSACHCWVSLPLVSWSFSVSMFTTVWHVWFKLIFQKSRIYLPCSASTVVR